MMERSRNLPVLLLRLKAANILENASSHLAEGATKASEKLSEAGSKVQNGLTELSETLHNMASEAGNDISNAGR